MKKRLYTKLVAFMMAENIYGKVKHICDEEELSISEWIRSAIELKLSNDKVNGNTNTLNNERD